LSYGVRALTARPAAVTLSLPSPRAHPVVRQRSKLTHLDPLGPVTHPANARYYLHLTSAGRGRQPETDSCIVLPVDTAPCTSTGTQLAHSRSKPNACSPDSLCLVRHEA